MALETQIVQVPIIGGMDTKTDERLVQPTDLLLLQDGELNNIGKAKTRDGYQEIDTVGTSGTKARCAFEYEDTMVEVIDQTVFDKSASQFRNRGNLRSAELSVDEITSSVFGKSGVQVASVNGYEFYAYISIQTSTGAQIVSCTAIDSANRNVVLRDSQLNSFGSASNEPTRVRLCVVGNKVFIFYDAGANLYSTFWDSASPTTSPIVNSTYTIASDLGTYKAFEAIAYDSTAMAFVYVTTTATNAKMGYLKNDGTLGSGVNGYPAVTTITETSSYIGSGLGLTKQASNGNLWFYYFKSSSITSIRATARVGTTLASAVAAFEVWDLTGCTVFGHIGVCWESATQMCVVWDRKGCSGGTDAVLSTYNTGNHSWTSATDFSTVRISEYAIVSTSGTVGTRNQIKFRCNIASDPFYFGTSTYVWLIYCGTALDNSFYTSQNTYYLVRISDGFVVAKAMQGVAAQQNSITDNAIYTNFVSGYVASGNTYSVAMLKLTPASSSPFRRSSTAASYLELTRPIAGAQVVKVSVDLSYVNKIEHKSAEDVVVLNDGIVSQYDGESVSEIGFHTYPEVLIPDYSTPVLSVTQQGTGVLPEIRTLKIPAGWRISPRDYFTLFATSGVKKFIWAPGPGDTYDINVQVARSLVSASAMAQSLNSIINSNSGTLGMTSTVAGDTLTITNTSNGSVLDGDVSNLASTKNNIGSGNGMSDGTYSWIAVYEWIDKKGNVHRSAPSPSKTVAVSGMTAGEGTFTVLVPGIDISNKIDQTVSVILYRTTSLGTVYYRSSRKEFPATTFVESEYVPVIDYYSDAIISQNEILYTTGGVLENIAPPQAKTFHVAQDRAWVVPVEDPSYVWYSKTKVDGEGVAFNDTNILRVEPVSGGVNVVGSLDDKILFFEDSSILFTTGDGPDDLGQGQFLNPEVISRDIGCPWKESIGYFPDGTIFKSKKGWYLLDRGLSLSYIGDKVEAYNDLTVSSTVTIPDKHQIRITHTDGVCLVFDYFYKKWFVFTNLQAVDAFIYQDLFSVLFSDGTVWQETPGIYQDPGGSQISMIIETAWIKLNGFEGFQRVRRVNTLGSFKTGYRHNVKQYIDYSSTLVDNNYYESASDQIDFRTHLATQKCQAIKLRYECVATGASYHAQEVSGFTLEIGVKKGLNKLSSTKTTNNSISA